MSTNNNLHIYVGAENKDLEKLDNGIYKLNNPTGSFTVSIKEYEDELKKLDKASPDYEKKLENLKASYSDVVWIYQLSGSKLPENPTVNSFNEAIGNAIKWTPRIDELEVGGGFVYIQPYRKEQIPSVGLDRGAIFFSKGVPRILGAMWFEDEKGEKPIKDKIIGFGSTVYLLVYTKDLYGQMLDIQFKDDDSMSSKNEKNHSDDDLGIYPNSPFRDGYRMEYDIPEKIQRDSKVIRQVNAINININAISDNAIRGELLVEDGNKTDQKIQKDTFVQGVYFPVYIDPFWSKEAYLETIEGEEIEVFPTISNKNIEKAEVLKNATLKVSINAKPINEHIERGNKPVLVGEAEANYAFYHHCRYTKIVAQYGKEEDFFLFEQNKHNESSKKIIYEVIADDTVLKSDKSAPKLIIKLPDLYTEECNKEKDGHKSKVITLTKSNNTFLGLDLQKHSFSFYPSYPKPTDSTNVIKMAWLPNISPIIYNAQLATCRFQHDLEIKVYPDIYYEVGFKFATENPFFKGQTKSYTKREYLGGDGFFTKSRKKQQKTREKNYENEKAEIKKGRLNYNQFEIVSEWGWGDKMQQSITLHGEHPAINIINSTMWVMNKIGDLCFQKEADAVEKEIGNSEQIKERERKKKSYLKGKVIGKTPFKIEISNPSFAGAVKWQFDRSEKEEAKIGELYEVNFKADLELKGCVDLLLLASRIPAVRAVTATLDTISSADDFWNSVVDFLGLKEQNKIQIDMDYYIDLFASGTLNLEANGLVYHSIDGFRNNNFNPSVELKFGIECGGSLKAKYGNVYSINAELEAKSEAIFSIVKDNDKFSCKYQGLYLTIETRIQKSTKGGRNKSKDNDINTPKQKKILLHNGFSYEFKLD